MFSVNTKDYILSGRLNACRYVLNTSKHNQINERGCAFQQMVRLSKKQNHKFNRPEDSLFEK